MPIPDLSFEGLSTQGKHFLLAVSGGRDSMCMLQIFAEALRKEEALQGARLSVASVHHGMRGVEADADIALVQSTCQSLEIPFHAIYLNPQELQGSGGFEARARDARYRELQTLRERIAADFLCTAHHQQDQVETLLLRLLRGTGIWGLRGILTVREDKVLRPLLHVEGLELARYAAEKGISWREDSTNSDHKYKRNYVRHSLVPHLKDNFPKFEDQLLRISGKAFGVLAKIQKLSEEEIAKFPEDFELRRLWFATHGQVHGTRRAVAHYTHSALPVQVGGPTTVLDRPKGSISWGANMYLLAWQFRENPGHSEKPDPASGIFWIDVTNIAGAIQLRSRQDGDLFTPPGLRCTHRKLKKYLQEIRIPLHERNAVPLVALGAEVLWVGGYAVSGNHQVLSQTRTVLELRLTTCHRKTP